jgi:glycosyltransferase XagB
VTSDVSNAAVNYPVQPQTQQAASFNYKGQTYTPHTELPKRELALDRLSRGQIATLTVIVGAISVGLVWDWHMTLVVLISVITFLYFVDLIFTLFLVSQSLVKAPEIKVTSKEIASRREWPKYSVMCPLYKEPEILPQFSRAMRQLTYPKDKLEVLLVLEEDDAATRKKVIQMALPDYFKVVVVPQSAPKTKPKACNFGLNLATGEYAVIYDAEDIPEKDQLKKAVLGLEKLGQSVFCLQAKLNYYNINQNLLTRMFTLEYSLWFDLVLTGLQKVGAPIPLGGTSNHFRTTDLKALCGWDPFNVTEDADLGIRIAKLGYKTAILDSTTMEEANSKMGNWLRQRSRWIKGYAQTYFMHMRSLRDWNGSRSRWDVVVFQLVVGGKVTSILINPILWGMTIVYMAFRPAVGGFIESLYVAPVFYMGLFSLVIGNFLYMYYYMMGAAKRDQWELIPYSLLVPFYWLAMSFAGYYALFELLTRPHYWQKTKHGLHLASQEQREHAEALVS